MHTRGWMFLKYFEKIVMDTKRENGLAAQLTEKTEKLIDEMEYLINTYENETGISVDNIAIRFDGSECAKKIMIRCNYYNFESALVRK